MFKASVGHSVEIDSSGAAEEVIRQASEALDGATPQAGLLFCSINNDYEAVLARINAAFPGIELIGGTSDGEVSSSGAFAEDSVTFIAFTSDTVTMKAGVGRGVSKNGEGAAQKAAHSARDGLSGAPKLVVAFADSYATNGAAVSRGLATALGETPVVGGFTTDMLRLRETRQFFKDQALTDSAAVLVFGGPLMVSTGCMSGYEPIGQEGIITASEGNIVREIDRKPAAEFYKRYLGGAVGDPAEYSDYPLMVREEGEADHVMRSAVGLDGAGAMAFLSEMRTGAKVRISEASRDMVIEGARQCAESVWEAYPGKNPAAALLFSCACRKRLLGTRVHEELEAVKSAVATDLPLCGFYTYGEIAPARRGGRALFNNDSFVTALIGER